jgi:hypothetical protein
MFKEELRIKQILNKYRRKKIKVEKKTTNESKHRKQH